jgi:hypothetical protein
MRQAGEALCTTQVFCVFLFVCAASLFGALVSEISEIVVSATHASKELDENLESYTAIKPKCVLIPSPVTD